MTKSLLQLEKEFIIYQSKIQNGYSVEYKLITIINFWEEVKTLFKVDIYQSYIQIIKQDLNRFITETNLNNLTVYELKKLLNINNVLKCKDKSEYIIVRILTLNSYVGAFKHANETYNNHYNDNIDFSGLDSSFVPFEFLEKLCKYLSTQNTNAYEVFSKIRSNWEEKLDKNSSKIINCILVEKTDLYQRGKLCELECDVDILSKRVTEDKISLNEELKTKDDPFVGVIYTSIDLVKLQFNQYQNKYLHAHFKIINNKQKVTGDSIGIATASIMFTNLIKDEVHRHDRFISNEVVLTGSLDKHGSVLPINEDTLLYKIERIFFSHINYLVLPEENYENAKQILAELNKKYPHRELILFPVKRFSEIIRNKNIICSEKVCFGEFTAKTVYKYSRMTKIQVPLLIILVYTMLCILFPKTQLWFDWSPQYLQITDNGFEALNADSLFLWEVEMDCPIEYIEYYAMEDIDNDGLNEVTYSPSHGRLENCQMGAYLFLYDDNGEELWRRDAVIYDQYPGDDFDDKAYAREYGLGAIKFIKLKNEYVIITALNCSYPSRAHIRLWSASGESKSWYINSGTIRFDKEKFYFRDDGVILLAGINNNLHSATLLALDLDLFEGVSPPYNVFDPYDIDIIKGNQIQYVRFPRTDVALVNKELYNGVGGMVIESPNKYWINVNELTNVGDKTPQISYIFDSTLRVQQVRFMDQFVITRNLLVAQGLLPKVDWDEYREERKLAVEYWIDSSFVTERELRALENIPQ